MNISGIYDLKSSAHLQTRPHSAVICKTILIGPGETALNHMYSSHSKDEPTYTAHDAIVTP